MPRPTSHLRLALAGAALALLAGPAWAGASNASHAARSATGSTGPLHVIGQLPEPKDRVYDGGQIAYVDSASRRMYLKYLDHNLMLHLVTYDLRPRIPRIVADDILGPDSVTSTLVTPYQQTTLDERRHRLVMITANTSVAGQTPRLGNPTVTVFDLTKKRLAAQWNLATTLPGYEPFGITYSKADDRLYMIGDFTASTAPNGIGFAKVASPIATVVALNPGTGSAVWMRPIPQCQQPLYSLNSGSLIARSAVRPALYFACVPGGTASGQPWPGQPGLVRLDLSPHINDSASAAKLPVEFFPIAGQYFNGEEAGIATFDYAQDRFMLQSLSPRTPGAWVFDGRMSAWVGFVSAPLPSDFFAGFNEGLQHYYMGLKIGGPQTHPTDGIVVADTHQVPVPAGEFQRIITSALIPTDSKSRRLFILPVGAEITHAPYLVAVDTSPAAQPLSPLNYDSLTDGVPESKAAFVSYSADANAYGADVVLVGGLNGPTSMSGSQKIGLPVAGGSRGVVLARVNGLGLRPAGASASAQSITADLNSTQDFETTGGARAWPYSMVTCLDSGGGMKPQSTDNNGDSSQVNCALTAATASGSSQAAAETVGPIRVGDAHADGVTHRDTRSGATTAMHAASSGIAVDVPGVGTLRIGSVTGELTTQSHGMAGAAAVSYHRAISGIELVDPNGKTLFGPSACATTIQRTSGHASHVSDSCTAISRALNPLTQTRLRVAFPLPQFTASPKGAYATVQQSDADFFQERTVNDQGIVYPSDSTAQRPTPAMQIEVYNDSTERSRVLAEFAAVQGDSIFDTTAASTGPAAPPPGSVPGPSKPPVTKPAHAPAPSGPVPPSKPTTIASGPLPSTTPQLPSPVSRLTGWLFLHRGWRDALLLAGTLSLAAGAGWLAVRRRRLILAIDSPSEGQLP